MEIRDPVFADAVAAIDAGDVATLDALLTQHPRLVTDRLPSREEGFAYFADPYLIWFIAENPIRNDRLPANIVAVANLIIDHLDRLAPPSRQHQLDYTVGLIATGKVPREAGLQLPLIDALIARGAQPSGLDATVAHNEMAAARRLIHHGAPLTLTAALCLGLDQDAQRLLPQASADERGDALLAAASLGLTSAIRFLLAAGIDPNLRSARLHRHATALHEAALTGKADLCQLLVDAGASLTVRDQMWDGTPAGWADHAGHHNLAARLRAAS
ncbi:MAG: ankyrin repeat domain-containing protein [Hyphomonadaceae bacterium]